MKFIKSLLIFISISVATLTASAANIKVYINPGHGSWGPNCRPQATIPYPALSSGRPDTLGFYESNTNLWKALALEEKLLAAGGFDVKLSRRANGPYPYAGYEDKTYNKALTTICAEAEAYNADYYISIHSNAGPIGNANGTSNFANYPVILYRGYTGSPKVTNSDKMAKASIARLYEVFYTTAKTLGGGPEFTSYYSPTNPNIVGDLSFYNTTSTYGYLGALKHSIPGFLSEGYFHTYSPARHRALNTDWCRQEGIRYYRGIMDYYGKPKESVGYIMGYIRTKAETLTNDPLYLPHNVSNDKYLPINGAKVVLRNSSGKLIRCNCYPYVERQLTNQPYYTTDNNYNGIFMFENLEPGTYSISVHKSGYEDYQRTVTVTADKTIYPEIFLTPGTGTEPDVSGDSEGDIVAEYIEMKQTYVNQSIGNAITGKTIRRAIYGNGVMYILAVDASKNPTLLAVDPTTHTVIAELPTNFCVVNSPEGYKLSDIALTSDGVLIGCSMDTVRNVSYYGSSDPWNLYKWTRDGNTWTGSKWFSRASNETAGNYYDAMVGSTIAYSGSFNSGTILTTAYSTAGTAKNMRLVRYQIANGAYSSEMRNNFPNTGDNANKFSAADDKYGPEHQLTASPRGSNRYVLSSKTKPAFEFAFTTSSTGSEPSFTGTSPSIKYGANYITYSGKPLMVAPKTDGSGNNIGVELYNITNGLNNATLIETTNTTLDATTPTYAMAAGLVEDEDITLYLLKDNLLSEFTNKGVVIPVVPHICAYDLNVTSNGSNYVFTFNANTDALNANIIFYDNQSGDSIGTLPLNNVVKGANTFTIAAADLPGTNGQVLNWAVDLETYPVKEWNKVYSTKDYEFTRPFISINNSPESPYFQYLYIAEREGASHANNGLYAFNPDYTRINDTVYKGGRSVIGSIYRSYVDDQGYVWFADGSDGYSGILVADPANLSGTFSEFFVGERQPDGLIKNGNIEVGSSCLGLSIYGTGEGAKLLAINEDGGNTLDSLSLAIYNIGKSSGIYAHSWDKAPSNNFALSGMAAIDGYPLGCSHGVWIATRRYSGQNNDGARALQFYDWNGKIQLNSADSLYAEQIKGSYSGACALSSDEKVLYFVNESGNIMVWDITWIGNKPNMTLRYTYETDLNSIREMHFDYAGNLVCSGEDEDITVFTIPTNNNQTLIPARKALTVTCQNGLGVRVTGIALDQESIRLGIDKTITLTATISPNDASQKEITWRSIDATIASVANGVVTGKKSGQTQVIATTVDGGYSDTCVVNVYGYMDDAEAQRIWAYDLRLISNIDTHTFNFKSVADATDAYLVFFNEAGNEVGRYQLDYVAKGANTITLSEHDIPTPNIRLNWGVELHADAIKETATLVEITDQSRGIYDFYSMMGVVVDNDPESNEFGKIYIQMALNGASDGKTTRAQNQTAGIFIYDQQLNELNNPSNKGILPTLPNGYTELGTNREAMKRLTINPKTRDFVFCNNIAKEGAVWSVSRDNLTSLASNLIDGVDGISHVNAICYDEEGSLYVLANINTGYTTYKLYKFTNGNKTELTLNNAKPFVDSDVAITSDGRGGLWMAQRRSGITQYSILSHVNIEQNKIDFMLDSEAEYADWFVGNCYRGAIAYNKKENILAVHGNTCAMLFKVNYDSATNIPTITKWLKAPLTGNNTDGLAFDYAGDLYVVNSTEEKFRKFAVPTERNVCFVPAQKAQVIDKKLNLRDTEDNSIKLNDAIDQTTNVRVFRTLTSGMYNTLCLPFDLTTLDGTPLAGAELLELNNVEVRETETTQDINLQFTETSKLIAGMPYLIQPTSDITLPMEFNNVMIATTEGTIDGFDVVTFNGILSPVTLFEGDKSVLFLTSNNILAWPNVTANMNGMRAYFQLADTEESSPMQMSARISVDRGSTTEDIIVLIPTEPQETATKIMRNGMIYILRNGEIYTIQGTKVR
ncbi:MAG: N-acetylmuramoyl-L-alanine amidase [Paludibacteraceae bacterium]|nr:N-acetylmuramoyl-L-alanine amidase [Paludibacteraceae bacterium]